ncbi:hypothetical protein F5148DRAFT_1242223 [Russula earlei]|uniref:Uncharacterized protein n=1 Tax=Russula earlei TaxID=71964 RepID=A0ACC0TVG9_9AGAM|nr:hypothetical protein F5148DRAFT_1242223 [Russula earlei]
MRIIPLMLRIKHYSRAPPQWPGRPMIPPTPPDLTRVCGTVEMVSSGDISFHEDGQVQWSSEGVQLGGLGSAMGVIGMWTGPFWAWKVGSH